MGPVINQSKLQDYNKDHKRAQNFTKFRIKIFKTFFITHEFSNYEFLLLRSSSTEVPLIGSEVG